MLLGFCPASFGVLFCSPVLGCRYTSYHTKLLDWAVSSAPWWKINSFLSEIMVCWSCMEKIIKIKRAFSVIFWASPATRRSFQPLPQHPTVPQQTSDLIHSWQLQMQDVVFQATPLLTISAICCLYVDKHLLIEVATMACRLGANVYCNTCCNRRVGESTWRQLLLIEGVTVASTWHQH